MVDCRHIRCNHKDRLLAVQQTTNVFTMLKPEKSVIVIFMSPNHSSPVHGFRVASEYISSAGIIVRRHVWEDADRIEKFDGVFSQHLDRETLTANSSFYFKGAQHYKLCNVVAKVMSDVVNKREPDAFQADYQLFPIRKPDKTASQLFITGMKSLVVSREVLEASCRPIIEETNRALAYSQMDVRLPYVPIN